MKKIILFFCLTLVLSSCKILNFGHNIMLIEQGMTKNEVLKILGEPSDRQFHETEESWRYIDPLAGSTTSTQYYIVWFENNIVTSLTTYNEPLPNTQNNNSHYDRRNHIDRR